MPHDLTEQNSTLNWREGKSLRNQNLFRKRPNTQISGSFLLLVDLLHKRLTPASKEKEPKSKTDSGKHKEEVAQERPHRRHRRLKLPVNPTVKRHRRHKHPSSQRHTTKVSLACSLSLYSSG